MLVQYFPSLADPIVEVQFSYLLRESALDVFDCKATCARMAWFDDVEDVGVGCATEEGVVGCLLPGGEEVGVKVEGGIAFDFGVRRARRKGWSLFGGGGGAVTARG